MIDINLVCNYCSTLEISPDYIIHSELKPERKITTIIIVFSYTVIEYILVNCIANVSRVNYAIIKQEYAIPVNRNHSHCYNSKYVLKIYSINRYATKWNLLYSSASQCKNKYY